MEKQDIEYKQSWRDEYIKWICGFANANGGKLYIGIDDNGTVTGVADFKKLLEDIPNKTRDLLGVLVDVNLKTKAGKKYLEIITEPYPNPISYKGEYHYRSGSTKQELKGAALDRFILKKQGRRWDGVPLPYFKWQELSKDAIAYFKKKAAAANRIQPELLKEKNEMLLEKLGLRSDARYFKRAAAMLFHPAPEKFITGAFVKIGFFRSDADLAYQDEVHGPLLEQVDKTVDLLLTKYLSAAISYNGLYREEKFPVPEPALREAIVNAIIHKDYASANPIQISVYHHKLMIWNAAVLPDNWTIRNLRIKHSSQPFNPDIAYTFFRAGIIEAWGRGTIQIIDECKKAQTPRPSFRYDSPGIMVEFTFPTAEQPDKVIPVFTAIDNAGKVMELIAANERITIPEISVAAGISERTVDRILKALQLDNKILREGSLKSGNWKIVS